MKKLFKSCCPEERPQAQSTWVHVSTEVRKHHRDEYDESVARSHPRSDIHHLHIDADIDIDRYIRKYVLYINTYAYMNINVNLDSSVSIVEC